MNYIYIKGSEFDSFNGSNASGKWHSCLKKIPENLKTYGMYQLR